VNEQITNQIRAFAVIEDEFFLEGLLIVSPSIYQGEIDTGSGITQQDGKTEDNADVKRKDGQLTCTAMLDLKQESNLYVHTLESPSLSKS
jgi:hypothetical protein